MATQADLPRQVAFLSRVPLLYGIDERFLGVLAGVMELRREAQGTLLGRQGEPGQACFIIGHGEVEVVVGLGGEERCLAVLGPGHVVGEMSLIDGKKRSATLRCKTDVSVFRLLRDDFQQLLRGGNRASMVLLNNVARDLAQRVRSANERYAEIFSRPGETIAKLSAMLEALRASTESSVVPDGDEPPDLLALVGYTGNTVPSAR